MISKSSNSFAKLDHSSLVVSKSPRGLDSLGSMFGYASRGLGILRNSMSLSTKNITGAPWTMIVYTPLSFRLAPLNYL